MSILTKFTRRRWASKGRSLYEERSAEAVPSQLGLCLTNRCNIRCTICMRESFKPPEGEITLTQVKGLLKRMPYISGVCIMGLCEPLLNKEAADIIRWLKDVGHYSISLTTNGMVPITDDIMDALTRVDDMVFSIDSSDPETMRVQRGGADLPRIVENMENVFDYKRKMRLSKDQNPSIHINSVMTEMTLNQFPELVKFLEPYADDLTYLMVDPVSRPDYSNFEPLSFNKSLEEKLPEFRKIAKASKLKILGFDWMLKESNNWGACPLSWHSMFIEPNGDAYFCYAYRNVLGNVFKDDPLKVWNSPQARKFREALQTSTSPLDQCHTCNFAREGWQPGGAYTKNKEDVE